MAPSLILEGVFTFFSLTKRYGLKHLLLPNMLSPDTPSRHIPDTSGPPVLPATEPHPTGIPLGIIIYPYSMLPKITTGLLVLLFTYTGFTKLFAPGAFKSTLLNQPIPHILVPSLTFLVPAAEILVAAGLLFERTSKPALRIALALLISFTAYIAAILLHLFHKIPCPCGGIFRGLSWQQHLYVNLLLTALTAVALYSKRSIPSPLNLHA
jgi:putative oxidoreductase